MNRTRFVLILVLLLTLPAGAQTPAPPPPAADVVAAPLFVAPAEREFFALGLNLSRASFAHASVTRRAAHLARIRNLNAKVEKLAALAPDAAAARLAARDAVARAAVLLPDVNAPADVSGAVLPLDAQMGKPLALTGDAAAVETLNPDAARVLASLGEARQLSNLLNLPALKTWLKSSNVNKDSAVWYAEGVLAGIAEAADAQGQPTLLPSAPELATDLRGLRDWLSGRLPETPTPEQDALQSALSDFLLHTTEKGQTPTLTPTQLRALGDISRMLQAQLLPPAQAVAAQ